MTVRILCLLLAAALRLPRGAFPANEDGDTSRTSAVAAARAHRDAHGPRIVRAFAELLALPNVARDAPNIARNAAWLRDALAARGVDAQVHELADRPEARPVVIGRVDAPGARHTLGIYVHYDGQPVDPVQWTHPPFTPTLATAPLTDGGVVRPLPGDGETVDPDWRLYARSAGDDKSPAIGILAALDALRAAGITPRHNLVFLFEGEEEAGSRHLGNHLDRLADRLADVDAWLIADGPVHTSGRAQLLLGVRGYSRVDLTVYGAVRHLHSGHYGNWAPNPALELAHLLASMKDPATGAVHIAGFDDDAAPMNASDRAAAAELADADAALRDELGLARTEGAPASLMARLLSSSFNVRGMAAAGVGDAARNLIPSEATATIDMRLALGVDPEGILDAVEAHIRAQGYHIVHDAAPDHTTRLRHPKIARVDRHPAYRAVRTPVDNPWVAVAARAVRDALRGDGRALAAADDDDPLLIPTAGGTLPLYLFTDRFDGPVIIVPTANHDNNQHGPDENLRLANLWYVVDLMAALFTVPID
ncbi:MAG: M20/M25/M40 family metallo-hydrolase [Acidobacteriota bacterium]